MTFTPTVQGTNNTLVQWSLNPPIGTLVNGTYTAPSSLSSDTQVTISATSEADSTKTATAMVMLSVPVVPVGISVTPTSTVVNAGQSTQFTASISGTSNTVVSWSLSPNVGNLANGQYTAPANLGSQQTVMLTATSQADITKTATASLILKPVSNPPQPSGPPRVSISPGVATLSAGQTVTFTPTITGTSNTGLTWSVNPPLGTLTNGVYTAPASITSKQVVTVRITSVVSSTATSTAKVTLVPSGATVQPTAPVTITLSPGSASLTGGQSATFKPSVSGTTNTAVTWSLNPQVGTLTNGVYQAPAIISSQQSVTITAKSAADPTKSASATVSLTPILVTLNPPTVALAAGKSSTFLASVAGTSSTAVTWSLAPAVGAVINGVYTAPVTIASAQNVVITATSVVDSTKKATATVSLTPTTSPSNPATTTNVNKMPLEVMGPNGTTASASFSLPNGTNVNGLNLWLQIHGLKYDSEASVQVNNSAWLPLSTGNVSLLGLASTYGGIGGGFHTLQMTLNLPAGAVVAGNNTITFRFNGTDGVTSGYRVLAFNVQSGGMSLVPPSQFVEDDPNTWQPPLPSGSDIAAGQSLWRTASLTVPTASGTAPIRAHCADCHSEDGRDLKYFNYSNNSIQVRSVFHGLTAQQGNQIASYIRSLNVPNPGRPWNPPYQPGPGLDSQPVSNWSAGAGLDAVLDSDAEMQQYMLPGGSSANWAANAYLNVRELPIPIQLPDWNSWLPTIHPMDAFGAQFTSNGLNTFYSQLHNSLQPNSAASYQQGMGAFQNWVVSAINFLVPLEQNAKWDVNDYRSKIYSVALWRMVKQWELNQENGLEGMPQVPYGAKADLRAWYANAAFGASPIMLHMSPGPGLGNGSLAAREYLAYIWYHMQLILNDGQGVESGNSPIDYSYAEGAIKDLSLETGSSPAASLELMWLIKSLQEFTLNGIGPQFPSGGGAFSPTAVTPLSLLFGETPEWGATSPATQTTLTTDYVNAWFAQISSYTPLQYYTGTDGSGRPWASPSENPATDSWISFGGSTWFLLPRLHYIGVDPNLVDKIAAWAATVWPRGDWTRANSGTCKSLGKCSTD